MKNKLFNQTQWRLTLLFTSFLIIFLISFIVITYFSLLSIVANEQKENAIALAHEELKEHRKDIFEWHSERKKRDRHFDRDEIEYKPNARTFYYVVSSDGTIIEGDENYPEIRNEILNAIKGWEPKEHEVKKLDIQLDNGSKVNILLSGRTIYDNGQFLGGIYTGTNISEETKVIKTLLLILIILAAVFIVASVLLGYLMAGRAMVPISNAFNRLKEFTADASHELRTPLSIMQSSLEVIETEDRNKLSSFSLTVLEDLKDEVKRMSNLVNNLLFIARSDNEQQQINKTWFSLTDVLEKLRRNFQYEAEKNQINLNVKSPKSIKAFGDKEKITQLLYIIVENAIKYNVPNGTIEISVYKENNQLRINISDTGIGIPSEHINRIFDRFYRVDQSRSRESGGNGLGLSIAKWIVQSHNGKLEVTSEEGKGSMFSVLLPLPKQNEKEQS